ncbi:MAG: ribonuclease HII [Chloroflexi bacterium]|nr:ribonuclease HII [Chloroflexota bacterium]
MPAPTPTYHEEASLLAQGYSMVAGLDEVGRGPLAGPVVAGVVIFPPNPKGRWVGQVRDSKQLSAAQREKLVPYIQDAALAFEIGQSSPQEVDALGIVQATRLAMSRALDSLALWPQFLLLDALSLPRVPIPQKSIVHGDALCLSIAAASIVAKVARDRMMVEEDAVYSGYGFADHKGYGTPQHMDSLRRLGPCPIHRASFSPVKELVVSLSNPMVNQLP